MADREICCAQCGDELTGDPDGWAVVRLSFEPLSELREGAAQTNLRVDDLLCPNCAEMARDLVQETTT